MASEPKKLDISSLENVEKPKKEPKSTTYNLLLDVELELSVILGETDVPLKKVLDITKGSIIDLDNKTTQPIKLLANGSEVARGEVVIIEDNFGLRITEISDENNGGKHE
ncbi:MAG: FliM/FliN family flagellar motor switch protein [Candidatus Gastranaerophilales bacterium]|nr:FliM/FliN family flagellar motor switch protein [Candidatus Gastranaerophilales bacterium]